MAGLLLGGAVMASAQESVFKLRPYLMDVEQTEATVAFHLEKPAEATVVVDEVAYTSAEAESHFLRVTNLEPGRVVDYAVSVDGAESQFGTIRAASRPGESFSFAVYGDPRPGDNMTDHHHRDVLAQLALHEPDFTLVLGDMVDNGDQMEDWQRFFRAEGDHFANTPICPVMGDNDYVGGKGHYTNLFPGKKDPYRFEWGGVHFFGLSVWDSLGAQPKEELDAESEQYKWMEKQLQEEAVQNAPFRVVYMHDSVFIGRGRAAEVMRRVWHPLFVKYNVSMVFSSWHLYERHIYDGVYYVVSGGAGAELIWLKKNPEFPSQVEARRYHFCNIKVAHGTMTLEAIADDGTVFDSVRLSSSASSTESRSRLARAAKRSSTELAYRFGGDAPDVECRLFSYNCSFCRRLQKEILPGVAREHGVNLKVHYFDLSKQGTYDLFLAAGAEFGRQSSDIPAVFIGRSVLGGEHEIKSGLGEQIAEFAADPAQYKRSAIVPFREKHDTETIKEHQFTSLTTLVVFMAGLLDGVNPCAFTAIIFLVSYLGLVGGTRKQILMTGGFFTLGVFLTYMAIGAFFYSLSTRFLGNSTVALVVNSILLVLVLGLAIFSLVDFVLCLRGKATEMKLQLPSKLKAAIRTRIRTFARHNVAVSGAAFILGVIISGMELTCTGQVYVPIVSMISDPNHRPVAAAYLLLYNVAFILPLLVVFALAVFGVKSKTMADYYALHVAKVKLMLALLFIGMAFLILYNMNIT